LVRKGGKTKYSHQSGDHSEKIVGALCEEEDERWTEEGRKVDE
jgi:hypothetical protein